MAALVDGLKAMKAWILPTTRTPADTRYSPYILLAAFPPLPGEVVVRTADAQGICIATGSACSTRKKDRTRVPESMGIPPETAKCAVRISLGHATTRSDVDAFLAACARELPPLLSIAKGRGL